jgi:hypothetical protein
MHATDTRLRFVELRAQGWSLVRIAAELQVAKCTLVEWNRAARQEIHDRKSVEIEAMRERILVSQELELQRLTTQLNRIEAVLAKRCLDCLSTESLFMLAATVRAQLRRAGAAPSLASLEPLPAPPAPAASGEVAP